ncbi:MAG: alpha/beta hydrolase [Bacillota bacterium]
MPYIEVDGNRCYYAGNPSHSGVPLLFCHGSGGGHHHWIYQLKKLPKTINPLAVDLPGHGRSEGLASDNINSYRDWLEHFSQAVGLDQLVVAGHSMGGAIAMTYALVDPEKTRGLILVGSGAKLRVLPAFLDELCQGSIPAELPEYLYSSGTPEELIKRGREEVENTDPSVYLADLSACDRFDIRNELTRITPPVLIICGSEDQLTPVKYSRYLVENLPQGRLEIIEGAGHMVMLEKPEEVNQAITKFIEEAF